jgi:site-specific DNA-methyltransferase (cytosine-N4-specific)
MTTHFTCKLKAYIQPFEVELAMRELSAMTGLHRDSLVPAGESNSVVFDSKVGLSDLVGRLTYWESVSVSGVEAVTTQSLRESTVNVVRNGIALDALRALLPFKKAIPLPNRRCLRYGTHGIHEYRGKFFPQLVRSLINISGIQPGGVVADPMSGSGTTVVEAVLAGCTGRGLDMNPLSVFLGNVKVQLLSAEPSDVEASYEQLRSELMAEPADFANDRQHFSLLPQTDQDYLATWFSDDVLDGLDDIVQAINRLSHAESKALAKVALSNIIRAVSWQKNDDLRVRKEVRFDVEIDPKKEFLEEIGRSVRAVLAFLHQDGVKSRARFEIQEGDARFCGARWGRDSVDVIITSPPYATALPYLDTDRLSLCYLGLLPRPEHRVRDKSMIGNREISDSLRREYWSRYLAEKLSLPSSVAALVERVEHLNVGADVGFRRKNLGALLSKYFFDMREVIQGMLHALKPGRFAFVVVGNNHTIAGGQRIDIMTAKLLQDIAAKEGFEIASPLSMDMLISRDIFRTNAMASEEILAMRKPVAAA